MQQREEYPLSASGLVYALIREPLPIGCVLSDSMNSIFSSVAELVHRELRFVELRPLPGIDVSSSKNPKPPRLHRLGRMTGEI